MRTPGTKKTGIICKQTNSSSVSSLDQLFFGKTFMMSLPSSLTIKFPHHDTWVQSQELSRAVGRKTARVPADIMDYGGIWPSPSSSKLLEVSCVLHSIEKMEEFLYNLLSPDFCVSLKLILFFAIRINLSDFFLVMPVSEFQ